VRILDKSGSIVGAGFLVDETHVATCAHVVYEAWKGADKNEIRKLSLDVCMDFPFLEPGNIVKATVVKCQNPKTEDDIAVLKLKSSKPQGAAPSILKTSKNMWDHKFRTYGFPKGFNLGLWAEGAIQGPVGTSLVHIEADKVPGTRVKQGFSGAPVWDTKLDAVVGMVAEEDIEAEDKIAFMIPLEILARVWPELDNTAAIASWLPEPWNFESFLNDRRKYFTGREWLFDKINNWLKKTSDSLLLVTGGPGVGKSAIMAELINRDKNNKLLAYYVCQADTPATLEPANFI
jgi:S1-C subfamily serine protease